MEQSEQPFKQPRKEEDYQKLNKLISERVLETIEKRYYDLMSVGEPGDFNDASAEKMHKWIEESRERDPDRGLFNLIRDELRDVQHDPDENIERALKQGRQVLINEAKERGVFVGAKALINEAQATNTYEMAMKQISQINVAHKEMEVNIQPWWSEDFNGMLDEYKTTALLHMTLALARAKSQGDLPRAKALERELDLRSWGAPPMALESMALAHLIKQQEGEKIREEEEETVNWQRMSYEMQEKQYELLREGFNGVVQAVRERSKVNPETFDQRLPPWYKELNATDQGIIRTMLHINYFASIKRDVGMTDLEAVVGIQGLRFETRNIDNMIKQFPGYRVAMATMIKDLFNPNKPHLVISGTPTIYEKGKKKEDPKGGYEHLESETKLREYKNQLISKVEKYLEPQKDELEKKFPGTNLHDIATAAVSTADNLFFASGAYDSGDEQRKITPGSSNIFSESVRSFYMPGIKGKKGKWLIDVKTEKKLKKALVEEDFGGHVGAWIRENAARDPDFRAELDKDEGLQYLPDRLVYSLLDHNGYQEGSEYEDKTLAQVLLQQEKVPTNVRELFDFEDEGRGLRLNELRADELIGYYVDLENNILKIYKHLTSLDEKQRLDIGAYLMAVNKARKDMLLNKIFRNEDFMTMSIAMIASPNGLVHGTSKILLNLDPGPEYDIMVQMATKDSRLFAGMPKGFRKRLLERLNAEDQESMGGVTKSTFFTGSVGNRAKLRKRAAKNLEGSRG